MNGTLNFDVNNEGEARRWFKELDVNHDGCLDESELSCKLSDLGFSDSDIHRLMLDLDTDSNASIDVHEWVAGYTQFVDLNTNASERDHAAASASREIKFGELIAPSGGSNIPDTARRAIELSQLERIFKYVKEHFSNWTVSRVSTLQDDLTRGSLRVSSENEFTKTKLKGSMGLQSINLYDICGKPQCTTICGLTSHIADHVIKPATRQALDGQHCSMVELMAPAGSQPPDYFCSHWCGAPHLQQ